jgi:hypothetical protein
MWVAIDYRSKNWVAVLKGLGSTALEHQVFSHESYVKCNSNRKYQKQFGGGRDCWLKEQESGEIEKKLSRCFGFPHRNTIHSLLNKVRTNGVIIDRKRKLQLPELT